MIVIFILELFEFDGYIIVIVYISIFLVILLIVFESDVINFMIVIFILMFFELKRYIVIVVGISIVGVIILIFVVFLIMCMLKRCKF